MGDHTVRREKIDTFCASYLETFNATTAIVAAGSRAKVPRQAAYKFLNLPEVQQRLKELAAPRVVEREVRIRAAMADIEAVAHSRIDRLLTWGPTMLKVIKTDGGEEERPFHGVALKDPDEVSAAAIMAISEISVSDKGQIRIKLHDKMAGLEKLCKIYGLYTADPAEQRDELPPDEEIAAAIITALEEAALQVDQGG